MATRILHAFALACLLHFARPSAGTIIADYVITGVTVDSMTASTITALNLPSATLALFDPGSAAFTTVLVDACLAGYYSYDDAQTCTACSAGTYSAVVTAVSINTCASCESGKYSSTVGANSSGTCLNCPNATYFSGTGGASLGVCVACPADSSSYPGSKLLQACVCLGGFAGANGGSCTACNTSVWCLFGQANPCPTNSKSSPQSSSLANCLCNAGYYGDVSTGGPDLSLCQFCKEDHFCPGGAINATTVCPDGKYALPGSDDVGDCICPDFSSSKQNARYVTECVCDSGRYKEYSGQYTLGGWYCKLCIPGEFCFNNTNRTCPVHATSFGVAKSFQDCYCDPGYKNVTAGTEQSFCEDCPANNYCTGKGSVQACTVNAVSPTQSRDYTRCYCGMGYEGVNNSACVGCQSPTYCYGGLQAQCSEGTYSPSLAWDRLNCSCVAGRWGPAGGPCIVCSPGKYNTFPGCKACTNTTDLDCSLCEAGTYSTMLGRNTTCDACPAGKYSYPENQKGATVCVDCANGTFSGMGAGNCTVCAAGRYATGGASVCMMCPAGSYGGGMVSACSLCPAGMHGTLGVDSSIRTYPPKVFDSKTAEVPTIFLGRPAYNQNITLNSIGISYGSGQYSLYFSSVSINTNIHKSNLFDSTSSSAYWQPSAYNQVGIFNTTYVNTTYISSDYMGEWLVVQLPYQIRLTGYCFKGGAMAFFHPGEFKMYGSTDGISFSEIPQASVMDKITFSSYSSSQTCFLKTVTPTSNPLLYLGFTVNKLTVGSPSFVSLRLTEFVIYGTEFLDLWNLTDRCASCPTGTYSTAIGGVNASTCQVCQAGTFSNQNGAVTCEPCQAGTFSGIGAGICTVCANGTVSGMGAGNCTACADGRYATGGASVCTMCPVGSYGGGMVSACSLCPAGMHGTLGVDSSIRTYPPKVYDIGRTVEVPTTFLGRPAYTQNITLSSTGISYGSGVYSLYFSSVWTTITLPKSNLFLTSSYTRWQPNSYDQYGTYNTTYVNETYISSDYKGEWLVVKLPNQIRLTGYSFKGGAMPLWNPAEFKMYGSTDGLTFSEIPQASVMDKLNFLSYNTAGTLFTKTVTPFSNPLLYLGFTVNKNTGGSYSFNYLTLNKFIIYGTEFLDLWNLTDRCASCPTGTYSTALGPTSSLNCTRCDAGTYSTVIGAASIDNCSTCMAGTYSTGGVDVCQSCSPGTFSTAIGAANASTCQGCQAGTYLIVGTYGCQLCSPGTFSTAIGGVNASTCQVCQAGTFSTQEGGVSCSLCLAGSFSPQSATTCESCLAGAYTTGSGSGNCSLCDAGTYSLGGAEECTPCGVGLFNNERGGWNCSSCLDGSFAGEGKSEVMMSNGFKHF